MRTKARCMSAMLLSFSFQILSSGDVNGLLLHRLALGFLLKSLLLQGGGAKNLADGMFRLSGAVEVASFAVGVDVMARKSLTSRTVGGVVSGLVLVAVTAVAAVISVVPFMLLVFVVFVSAQCTAKKRVSADHREPTTAARSPSGSSGSNTRPARSFVMLLVFMSEGTATVRYP